MPRRAAALLTALLLAAAGSWVSTPAASAAVVTDGQCSTDTGVTLVVDHQGLGGGRVIKCVEDVPEGTSGLQLLRLAGMTPEGTVHDGSSFVCRIADRPSANETIPIAADPQYRETCVDTPPDSAFWGYWHANNGGTWTFSNLGGGNREVVPGGYEGWSFSLNSSRTTNPPPGIAPSHPVTPKEPVAPEEPAPPATTPAAPAPSPTPTPTVEPRPRVEQPVAPRKTTKPSPKPIKKQIPTPSHTPTPTPTASPTPVPTASVAASPTLASPSPEPTGVTPTTTAAEPAPEATPAPTAPPVDAVVADDGPPIGTFIGLGAVAVLGLGGGVIWWRRRGL